MDGFGGAGDGGPSAQGPSVGGGTYKFGPSPGKGVNREDIGGKKKKGKALPSMPQAEQSLQANVRVRPQRKRNSVTGGSTNPSDGSR